MAECVCVDPQLVHLAWPKVSHWVRKAVERTNLCTFGDVQNLVQAGNALLWLAWDGRIEGVWVTQLIRTEKTKACVILACGGENLNKWLPHLKRIENYAKAEGCDAVRFFGRKGWQRVLKDYSAPNVILEKRIT